MLYWLIEEVRQKWDDGETDGCGAPRLYTWVLHINEGFLGLFDGGVDGEGG